MGNFSQAKELQFPLLFIDTGVNGHLMTASPKMLWLHFITKDPKKTEKNFERRILRARYRVLRENVI